MTAPRSTPYPPVPVRVQLPAYVGPCPACGLHNVMHSRVRPVRCAQARDNAALTR